MNHKCLFHKDFFLLSRITFFFSILQRRTSILKEFFMLGRILKMFISSILHTMKTQDMFLKEFFFLGRIIKIFIYLNLYRRPRIFKEFLFMLGKMIKIFISSILQRRPSIFKEVFLLGRIKDIYFSKSAKKTYISEDFLLGRIIFICSILQKRHSFICLVEK